MENGLRGSVLIRMLFIGVLALVLLIPQIMIESLITERQQRRDSVTGEVSDKWGKNQTVIGPILILPYTRSYKTNEGKWIDIKENVHILPKRLEVESQLSSEIRYRSIFEVVLYSARISIKGEFFTGYLEGLQIPFENIRWKEAFIVLGISDLKGIRDSLDFRWDGKKMEFNSGVMGQDVVPVGLSSKLEIPRDIATHSFDIKLSLNGSNDFSIAPVGEQTDAKVSGTWGNPSFLGEFLPANRNIDDNSFNANWKILNLNRNYPQAFVANQYKIDKSAFGVKLLLPIDEYQKTMRTAKYAVMFIVLTFLAFFVSEILSSQAIHPVQYTLVGFGLLLFYVLLLSLSEHIAFHFSYLIAAFSIVTLTFLYARTMFGKIGPAFALGGVLIILYGFLYVIVQAQDYALLFGSFGLFISLAAVMYLTRKIDWFSIGKKNERGK
jgi:inner membrane protein